MQVAAIGKFEGKGPIGLPGGDSVKGQHLLPFLPAFTAFVMRLQELLAGTTTYLWLTVTCTQCISFQGVCIASAGSSADLGQMLFSPVCSPPHISSTATTITPFKHNVSCNHLVLSAISARRQGMPSVCHGCNGKYCLASCTKQATASGCARAV